MGGEVCCLLVSDLASSLRCQFKLQVVTLRRCFLTVPGDHRLPASLPAASDFHNSETPRANSPPSSLESCT